MLTGFCVFRTPATTSHNNLFPISNFPELWTNPELTTWTDAVQVRARGFKKGAIARRRKHLEHQILAYYKRHGHTPSTNDGVRGRFYDFTSWTKLVRGVGLCPRQGATMQELGDEVRRIHAKHGMVRQEHLDQARLVSVRPLKSGQYVTLNRRSLIEAYGAGVPGMEAFLDDIGVPHDFRTDIERVWHSRLARWVVLLETEGSCISREKEYSAMQAEGLHQYGPAVAELRRLNKRYGPPPET